MNYAQTIDFLYTQLPMFQRTGPAAYKNNLDNTHALDRMFVHPHHGIKTIHVAGTNGKGSVSHIMASILQSAGYKVGLYTSPHLLDFRERIKINGQMISEEDVCRFVEKFQQKNKVEKLEPSFFELTVMMAFDYFARQKVDVAVIEVGLGGRLDSTNIINPEVGVITNISPDHTNLLGKTIPEIAAEKAGIIKQNTPVVIGETQAESQDVFITKAKEKHAPIHFADQEYLLTQTGSELQFSSECSLIYRNLTCDLKGNYQLKNITTALCAMQILYKQKVFNINADAVKNGLNNVVKNTGLYGRWQQIGSNPKIICDTGHNQDGIKNITAQFKQEQYKNLHVVFGTVNDKDLSLILPLLPDDATYYFTKADISRALDEHILREKAKKFQLKGLAYPNVKEALEAARAAASENDMIFVGGSTFIVAEVLE
ncbi:MAG: bifunctional folylpolyglutamate synthase/dihydrofolate synthase [Prolixibacteraceae bacterium]|jgi:dihydrofolate synthase/folylpolyglutamate synthase|nr:bifunctional folylpolyglutamate synthase/dihydrofolate synthase [Prolixibacteraceae bacterium]